MGDDASVLAAALTATSSRINDEHHARAIAWMEAEIEPRAEGVQRESP